MRRTGFTLIEILIVMVIITIVGGMALLTIHHNDNVRFDRLARELGNTLQLAQEQAMLQPSILGLVVSKTQYQFYEYGNDTTTKNQRSVWKPVTTKELGAHTIPDDAQLTVYLRDKAIPQTNTSTPALIISTSGDIIPFTILIGKTGSAPRYRVIGRANGDITSGPIQP